MLLTGYTLEIFRSKCHAGAPRSQKGKQDATAEA